ncbi:MAG: hypothetical protein O2819_06470 [Planctomycetota bacterium]|nr:hypothetical protein [Planctomycetota bacterium]MDA1105242.1 hypothetical protein [Planctomycetota bacterium]
MLEIVGLGVLADRSVGPRACAALPSDVVGCVRETRQLLGIPEASASSGHQPGFWHCGILAKHLIAVAVAERWRGNGFGRAQAIHFVADHDANDGGLLEWPERTPRGWEARRERVLAADPGIPWATREWGAARSLEPSAPGLEWGTDRGAVLNESISSASGSPAQRVAVANLRVLATITGAPALASARVIPMSALMDAPLGQWLAASLVRDPARTVHLWNEAVSRAPRAARALPEDGSALPLWCCGPQAPRRRASVDEVRAWLAGDRSLRVLPSALVASSLTRLVSGLWIHGTGGRHYEGAGNAFWESMHGWPLPHFAVATATVRLPIGSGCQMRDRPAGDRHAAHAVSQLARNPELLLGTSTRSKRLRAAEAVRAAPRNSAERRRRYEVLRGIVRGHSVDASDLLRSAIDRAEAGAKESGEMARSDAVAGSREWAAWIHPVDSLRALTAQADDAVRAAR